MMQTGSPRPHLAMEMAGKAQAGRHCMVRTLTPRPALHVWMVPCFPPTARK